MQNLKLPCLSISFLLITLSFFGNSPINSCQADSEDTGKMESEAIEPSQTEHPEYPERPKQSEQPELPDRSSAVKTIIKRDLLERLPESDDILAAFSLAPGSNGSGNIRVHGGALNDNVYLVDGIDITDPVTSTIGLMPYADTVDSVEILTGAFPAEYGRSMGGILNVKTRRIRNDFHGVLRYKIVDSDTRSDYKWPYSDSKTETEYDYRDYAATIDGPVIRDKLWFLASCNFFTQNESGRSSLGYRPFSGDEPIWKTINLDKEFLHPSAKVTFEPARNHRIDIFWNQDSYVQNNYNIPVPDDYYYTYITAEALNTREDSTTTFGITWNWTLKPELNVKAQLGGSNASIDDIPTRENDTDPGFFDQYYQKSYNNSTYWTEEDRSRMHTGLTVDFSTDDMAGSHQWKSGIDRFWIKSEEMNKIPGGACYSITQIPVGDPDNPEYFTGTDATRTTLLHPGSVTATGDYYALFFQDDWSVKDDITLNLGIRYETMEYKNDTGDSKVPAWRWGDFTAGSYLEPGTDYYGRHIPRKYGSMKFDNMIAPRAGVVWDIFGTGESTVQAFWGRYYNPFDLSLPGMFQPFESDPFATRVQYYVGPEWTDRNKDGVPDESYFFDRNNYETTDEDGPSGFNMIDPELKPEYTDELSIGFRHQILKDVSIGFTYTNRGTRDMIEDVGLFKDGDGNIVWTWRGGVKADLSGLDPDRRFDPCNDGRQYAEHVYWITNVPGNKRDYQGFEFSSVVTKTNWDLLASYTYSKAEGCVTENQPGYSGISHFSGHYDTYQFSQNLYGELPWSCRHYLKLAGSYHVDLTDWYEISFGLNGFLRSGYFYSIRMAPEFTYDPGAPGNDIDDPDTWTGRPPLRSYAWSYPKGRGGCELPSYYSINVSLQNTFEFGRFGAATVILDVENLTDNQGIISESDVINPNVPHLFGQQNGWATPRLYRLSLKYSF